MKLSFTQRFTAAALIIFACGVAHAQSDPLPAGWLEAKDTRKNALEYSKEGDSSGSIVKIYPAAALKQRTADEWLREKLTTSKAPKGIWLDDLSIKLSNANTSYGHRSFKLQDGTQGRLDALVVTTDQVSVRLGVSIYIPTENNGALLKESMTLMSRKLVQSAKQDDAEKKTGSGTKASASLISGIQPGGVDIKPGIYVGTYGKKNKKELGEREIILYDNGEYEFLHEKAHGEYVYSKGSGRFEMEDEFHNNDYNGSFAIYGINEKTNEYTIYAEVDRAYGNNIARLVWSSPPDRLPPSIREEQESLKKEEDRRYKYTTQPGEGIKESDIETVLYTWQLVITGFGTNRFKVDPYLLMKDGRVMDDVPVAPFILDEAKSRSREPDRWGWWKREDGKFVFAWTKNKDKFARPSGTQGIASPIPAGTRLEGTWRMGSSFSTGAATAVSFRGVTFTSDGRFKTNNSSMVGVDGEQLGGDGYTGTSTNDGVSTSFASVGPLSSGSRTDSGKSGDDRKGSYTFDGYNLTLEYDNGKVVQEFTFAMGDDYTQLWFKGGSVKRQE